MTEVDEILNASGFKIKEWHCSCQQLQQDKNETHNDTSSSLSNQAPERQKKQKENEVSLDKEKGIKTLSVSWNPQADTIYFQIKFKRTGLYTKRTILSNISRLFDPLGLATAITIKARMALQEIWKIKNIGWDDPLPSKLQLTWEKLFDVVKYLKNVQFPRCLQPRGSLGLPELHVFADASNLAYGAAAYLVWTQANGLEVRLISAKARVAPLRQTTIPRLELMAALLASRLAKMVHDEFKIKPSNVILWSDSMIVLAWLRSESTSLQPFVGVRVAEIQATWESATWRHVPTDLNPTDDLSRGILFAKINERWMNGPSFLKGGRKAWPPEHKDMPTDLPNIKVAKPIFTSQRPSTNALVDPYRFSNWKKLCRVTAYCLRFIKNLKASK
ncbi:uncharacterized protein LOC114526780 [Dendronephthya gigantea]|uniref:uncharacterized protein LOC114526780 n=1 Tax=Dendronephthya gigantea TaxID=151771 RepID=UPI00106D9608|nr:uncharacterized protein LOC114526780 [Dendronephthya gigantea]